MAWGYYIWDMNDTLRLVPQAKMASPQTFAGWLTMEHSGSRQYSAGYVVPNIWVFAMEFWAQICKPVEEGEEDGEEGEAQGGL
ncbi:hypothetical protein EIP91_004933 [Steccherinum ochraceum]|uniref:Uncharacterized protein n=1 Tax=Steccherinum ochraceum TaxID=92696 RepID=A0A4R0R7Y7_9APHY|nr:hypothetical protein EIP91_004933 [Steccherinum ochraceum]